MSEALSDQTVAASTYIYKVLKARIELVGLTIKDDDEFDNLTQGIAYWVVSDGADWGLTDGHCDVGDPLFAVVAVGSSKTEIAPYSKAIKTALEGTLPYSTDYGNVVGCARTAPYSSTKKRPSKAPLHILGGLFRMTVVPN